MICRTGSLVVAIAIGLSAFPASGQEAAGQQQGAACAAPGALPAPLAGWAAPHAALKAAAKPSATKEALLTAGKAVDATLLPTPSVKYSVAPGKPGGTVSFGGLFAFDAPEAGTYRVAINNRSWIDVIEDGAAVQSAAHGHGPDCSGITKMVDYSLKPGRHILQIAANGEPALSIMVARLP
jgi:hypothetical protein